MKVALVYDRVNKWGGAERVLLALHELFPKAPLFTSVYHPSTAKWADAFTIKTSFLQKVPFAQSKHELFPLLMPAAFESFSFDEYDLVISVSSEAAKGVIAKPHTKHIFYCLTPTRYLWSGYDTYFSNKFFKTLSKPAVTTLKKWDKIAAQRPDMVIAISEEVQARVKKYYQKEALVIYPPATLGINVIASKAKQSRRGLPRRLSSPRNDGYFLVVSRLSKFTRYKRIDLAIEACNALQLPLKVVGTGSWEKELKAKAGPTIEFVGNVTDEELIDYYKNCKALIFPGIEDFGLTMVEAQKFGKPVIAFAGGGASEIILDKKTGYFFEKQTREALMAALEKFPQFTFDSKVILKQAEKFSAEKFKKNFQAVVNKLF